MHACMNKLYVYACMHERFCMFMHAHMYTCMHAFKFYVYACMHARTFLRIYACTHVKLIAFELAAKFSRRRENPVQPRLCNAQNAIFKRLKTGFSLWWRSSPANSDAISFISIMMRLSLSVT